MVIMEKVKAASLPNLKETGSFIRMSFSVSSAHTSNKAAISTAFSLLASN